MNLFVSEAFEVCRELINYEAGCLLTIEEFSEELCDFHVSHETYIIA